MTAYVEPTPRARQLFFLIALLLVALLAFAPQLDHLLPPLSDDSDVMFDEIQKRTLVGATFSTAFFILFSLVAIHLSRRTVQSGQWPPAGMAVPFRIKVKPIQNSRNVWVYLAVTLSIFTFQAVLPWVGYSKQQAYFGELKTLMRNDVQPSLPPEVPASRDPG